MKTAFQLPGWLNLNRGAGLAIGTERENCTRLTGRKWPIAGWEELQ